MHKHALAGIAVLLALMVLVSCAPATTPTPLPTPTPIPTATRALPPEVAARTSEKYLEGYRALTGRDL